MTRYGEDLVINQVTNEPGRQTVSSAVGARSSGASAAANREPS